MTSAADTQTNRNSALDFTKGALVLIMVLYHWINYFYGPHDNRYLRFLTPSFIFITGFLISNVYLSKYSISDPKLPRRLVQRGAKILGVFLILNAIRALLVQGASQSQFSVYDSSVRRFIDVYIIGSGVGGGQSKAIAFSVLIPIGYLLVMASILVITSRFYRYSFHAACLIFLLFIVTLAVLRLQSPNLELIAIGFLGVLSGYLPKERVEALVDHPYWLGGAYILYLVAISIWDVIYPLQVIGVFLSLAILYLLGQTSHLPRKARDVVVLLGKYSLFGYIIQIVILQFLHFGLAHLDAVYLVLVVSVFLAFALTILAVAMLDYARLKSTTVNKLYGVVFA